MGSRKYQQGTNKPVVCKTNSLLDRALLEMAKSYPGKIGKNMDKNKM